MQKYRLVTFRVCQLGSKRVSCSYLLLPKRPVFTPSVSRMTLNFDTITNGVQDLKTDFTNGSRVLATKALHTLHDAIDEPSGRSRRQNQNQLWRDLRIAAYKLSQARPSMSAAITSAVIQALSAIKKAGDNEDAKDIIKQEIERRRTTGEQIVRHFVEYVNGLAMQKGLKSAETTALEILTLSSSSTLRECLTRAVREIEDVRFVIRILESRPNCEGADFAVSLLRECNAEAAERRLRVDVAPESHVSVLASDTDILLLGADRISADGDVSNKMGSLASALCVKMISPRGVVVVASDSDKIARFGAPQEGGEESGPSKEVMSAWRDETRTAAEEEERNLGLVVHNAYFEWVPEKYIDFYLTEQGGMESNQISERAQEKKRIEDELFDEKIRSLAED